MSDQQMEPAIQNEVSGKNPCVAAIDVDNKPPAGGDFTDFSRPRGKVARQALHVLVGQQNNVFRAAGDRANPGIDPFAQRINPFFFIYTLQPLAIRVQNMAPVLLDKFLPCIPKWCGKGSEGQEAEYDVAAGDSSSGELKEPIHR
ncbi:unnamed protein product [marine sediment metagenome]|uniref:Uncharacterized protein n=1 Tax=marine sediment metagenome TaxID=412755 RepID=X1MTC5_9ZZZZ